METQSVTGEAIGNAQAAAFIGVSAGTWRSYVARGQAPAPSRREISGGHALPVWTHAALREWIQARPGRGGPGKPRAKKNLWTGER